VFAGSVKLTHSPLAVLRKGTTLNLDLEDGSTIGISTAEETSSVMLRDKNRALEYAD
jgi:hypothetical protein